MAQDYSINLLPPEDQPRQKPRKPANDQDGDVVLHVPKDEEKQPTEKKEKSHWWSRKKKKDKKVKEPVQTKKAKPIPKLKKDRPVSPELFSDVIAKDEPKEHWWSSKQERPVEPKPAPTKKIEPKPTPPPVKKAESKPQPRKAKVMKPDVAKMKPAPAMPETKTKPLSEKPKSKKKTIKEKERILHQPEKEVEETFGINLVSDYVNQEVQKQTWWLAGASLFLVVAVWVIVGGFSVSRARNAQSLIQAAELELVQVENFIKEAEATKVKADVLQTQFSSISGLLDQHVYWTEVFRALEEVTLPSVYYTTISASQDTTEVFLTAIAKDFAAAARQIRAYERAPHFVEVIDVNQASTQTQPGAALPVQVVGFDIRLQLTENFLLQQNEE